MSEKDRTWSFCDPENPEEWFGLFKDISGVAEPKNAAKLYAYELDDYEIKKDFDADSYIQAVMVKSPEGIVTEFRLIPYLEVRWKVEED